MWTRLVTIVKNDCKEWMSEQETSAIVVFPPNLYQLVTSKVFKL